MKVSLTLEAVDKASATIRALQKTVSGVNATAARGAKTAAAGYAATAKAVNATARATARADKATVALHTSTMRGTARATQGHVQTARAVTAVTRATDQAAHAANTQTRAIAASSRAQAGAATAAARTAAAQDRVTAAATRAARETERAASAQAQIARQERRYRALERLAERRGREFGGGLRTAGGGFARVGSGAGQLGRSAAGIATGAGLLGVGAGFVMQQMVEPAAQYERLNNAVSGLEKSGEKTRKSMAWLDTYSFNWAVDIEEATKSFIALRRSAIDPTGGALKTLGDAAVATQKPIWQATEALTKGMAGSNEGLRAFGIEARTIGKKANREIQYVWTDTTTGIQKAYRAKASDGLARAAAIFKVMAAAYGGSLERDVASWDGMIRRLHTTWGSVTGAVMSAGLFEWMHGRLGEVLTMIERATTNGSLQKWAGEVSSGLQHAMEIAWQFGKGLVAAFQVALPWMERAATWMGGWDNLVLGMIALPLAPALIGIAAGFAQIAGGMAIAAYAGVRIIGIMRTAGMFAPVVTVLGWAFRMLVAPLALAARAAIMFGVAMMTTPIGWVVAGIAAIAGAAYLIYDNWGQIGPWLQRQWDAVTQGVSDAWAAISGISWSDLIPKWDWLDIIPSIQLPALSALSWRDLVPKWDWLNIIPSIQWPQWLSFSWRDLVPKWDWLDIIPSMPDFSSWFGSGSAGAEKLGAALPNDPAALERMATATASIAQHASAVAAVDASAALTGLNGAAEAATRATALAQAVLPAAQQAMTQTRVVMSSMSFRAEGVALMTTLAAGIRAGAAQAVTAVRGVAQQLRDHLPHSPAKTGPLSDLHRIRFSETLAAGIRPGPAVTAVRTVAAGMMGALAMSSPSMAAGAGEPLSAGVPAGGGGPVTVHAPLSLTINGNVDKGVMGNLEQALLDHRAVIERIVADLDHSRRRMEY